MIFDIVPVSEPRMTRSDKWKLRKCVAEYRAFCDECRAKKVVVKPGDHVIFYMPAPKSWSAVKARRMSGQPHLSKPDVDNLLKALLDVWHENDSHIWDIRATKLWAVTGRIEILRCADAKAESV